MSAGLLLLTPTSGRGRSALPPGHSPRSFLYLG